MSQTSPHRKKTHQLWVVSPCMRLSRTCFSSEVREDSKTGSDSQAQTANLELDGTELRLDLVRPSQYGDTEIAKH